MARSWNGIRVSVASDKRFLGPLRTLIRETIGLLGFPEIETEEVVLAVQEGCANVIRHCYDNREDERIDIALVLRDDELEIRIRDYGQFVDPGLIKSRDLDDVRPGGLGVHIMKKVMDDVTYKKNKTGGTTLILRKRVPAAKEGGA